MKQHRNRRNKQAKGTVSAPSRQRTYSLIAFVLLIAGGSTVFMKTERAKPVCSNRASAPANKPVTYDELFRQLVIEHPAPEISHDLYRLIESGHIAWSLDVTPGRTGMFVVPVQDGQQKNQRPILAIRSDLLAPEKQAYAQLVLYHEYQHIAQWQSREIDETVFFPQGLGAETSNTDLCQQTRQAEVSAYRNECVFARQYGLAHLLQMCALTDAAEFDAAIEEMLARDPALQALCRS